MPWSIHQCRKKRKEKNKKEKKRKEKKRKEKEKATPVGDHNGSRCTETVAAQGTSMQHMHGAQEAVAVTIVDPSLNPARL